MTDILVVDDEPDIRELIADILQDEGHGTRLAWDSETAFAEINKAPPNLIILDIWLKESRLDGIEILKKVRRDNPEIPVVIISGHGNIEIAVAAIKQGAYDFIEKPFNIDQLMVVITRALEASRLRHENAQLRVRDTHAFTMLGEGPAFRTLRSQLDKVTRSNGRVMLKGPAGSGKEVAARYIHRNSPRASGPFVVVNSASIAPDAMEEVLFGREGPGGTEPGLFERAHTGILFFDEVADMPPGTQAKILRVLVDQAFQRVGGTNTVRVDVRVISATTRDLSREVAEGRFRTELYHRLAVVPIDVPGLEARREDIPLLARRFLAELAETQGLAPRALSPDAEAQLQTMRWPGNVRQLRNTLERALILGPDHGPIEPEEVLAEMPSNGGNGNCGLIGGAFAGLALREAREMFEREYLLAQVNRFGGNISRTANFVGMERSALHRKLKSLNVIAASRNGNGNGSGRVEEMEEHV
jgi:two-component system, NtrC family, nitrogen regulation response regulator NtrX